MSDRSPSEIEREVERTRANVEGTLEALRERLNPQQLLDQVTQQAMDYVRGSGGQQFMQNLGTGVRDNPLPVLLVGAGIAWMMLSQNRGTPAPATGRQRYVGPDNGREGIGETASRLVGTAKVRVFGALDEAGGMARDAAEAVGDAASRAASAASHIASDAADAVSGTASRLTSSASDAASGMARTGSELVHRASGAVSSMGQYGRDGMRGGYGAAQQGWAGLDRLAHGQPLLFGALGLALGAALGAILPRTEAEDELMGEARDALAGQVRGVVGEAYGQIRETAGEQIDRTTEAALGAYNEVRERVERDGLGAAGDAVTDAARDVSRTAGEALRHVASEVSKAADQGGQAGRA
jgi:uncharacterized protein YjbJ (UPF0337 family)